MLKKYGFETNSQRGIGLKNQISLNDDYILTEYNNGRSASDIGKELNVFYGTIIQRLRAAGVENIRTTYTSSIGEKEMFEFCKALKPNAEHNVRGMIGANPKLEIDIFFREEKIGIEYNGLYWHSSATQAAASASKDHDKIKDATKSGIRIISVFEDEWRDHRSKIEKIIRSAIDLKSAEKIFARKLKCTEIDTASARNFLDANHIQGFTPASSYIALVSKDDGDIKQVATFGRHRFQRNTNEQQCSELIRFATKDGIQVVGGLSKLITNWKRLHPDELLLTYCDRRLFSGNGYAAVGKFLYSTKGNYFWTDKIIRLNRYQTQKSKLEKLLGSDKFNSSNSENKNMFDAGWRKLTTVGHDVYEL